MIPNVEIDMSEETIKHIGTKFFEIKNEYKLSISEIKFTTDKILIRMEYLAIIPSKRKFSPLKRDAYVTRKKAKF